ncbi:MAG: Flp pilus assembly complex ATPase component TadA [Desulfobulbaceae bacterium]|uniref:Flp pilus assembly complex ATPase component TadA n=1 Tax=Candidatus Desulfatifera sulfidica TaxID=2841691 RepID=A0A8J6N7K4_9BACT|nr:Flp pilus assembly complex ATPase component TadA [Candidatus Desulfatifera sulfidica]
MDHKGKLGDLLLENKIITQAQLFEALAQQGELGLPIGETLIYLDHISEHQLLTLLSEHLQIDYINLSENNFQVIDCSLATILSEGICQSHRILPVFLLEVDQEKEITLAMSNPLDESACNEVEKLTGYRTTPVLTTASHIEEGIRRLFQSVETQEADTDDGISSRLEIDRILYVNRMLAQAIQLKASDIHIEPHATEAHVRYRIDGVLHLIETQQLEEMPPVVSRFKVMGSEHRASMNLDKKNIPHDGSFARVIGGHSVDFRVSTFPTIYGEKVVVRILDRSSRAAINTLSHLMMAPATMHSFLHYIKQPNGIIIATGPAGSGKTTTLHAAINEINNVGLNIVTVEDPVEYHAPDFINQSNLLPQAGFTYPRALRSILRQDPDVILIGEIRDLETAEVAIHAALTGHLVFTTMHTDTAAGAVVRLVDLGIDEFILSSTVVSSLNQRLLRKNCPDCAEKYSPNREELNALRIDQQVIDEILANQDRYDIRKGKGCTLCRKSGYYGRHGVYELLAVTPPIKKMIRNKETSDVISTKSREFQQLNMLFEDGLRLVLSGITTFSELQRVPRGDYPLKSISEIFATADITLGSL